MWKFVSIIAVLSILIGNGSCLSYTMDSNQNIVKVKVNKVVRVNLELISGTGYDWFVEENPYILLIYGWKMLKYWVRFQKVGKDGYR